METENYVNQDLKKIARWATGNKIEFNNNKSKVLFISREKHDTREANIYLNYKRLDQNEEIKYLGIYLDSKFNFNAHIDHTVAKLITLINMLARTAKLQWGLGHKVLKTIYEGAVVPILTHGAPIWIEAIRKNKNLAKYKRIQRLINIKIAKAYQTISYDASCMIAGERPTLITIEQKVQTYMATKINNLEYDAPLEIRYWRNPAELATVHEVESGAMYTTEVYADGSKTGDSDGAAGIIFVNGKLVHGLKFKLHGHCSNNQAEQHQLKFKLHGHCSNNKAEQIVILKVLEKLE